MKTKILVFPDGRVTALDPSLEGYPILKKLNPDLRIESLPPPRNFIPNLRKLGRAGLLSKIKAARETLSSCSLCGHNCGKNRFEEKGRCGLGDKAFCSTPFVHICQERVINPSATLKVFGCALKCAYCISIEHAENWQGSPEALELSPDIWGLIDWREARCLEFGGGNPTESIPGIIEFLSYAPEGFSLPIVWNDHLFTSRSAVKLLEGIADVFIADFKFGPCGCSKRLSEADDYWETAKACLKAVLEQGVRVILRILVVPSLHCCRKSILEWLAQFRDRIWVSILDQYIPSHKAGSIPEISGLAGEEEVQAVERLVRDLGFRDVNKDPEGFWE